jgi:hypothetical protein
LTRAPRLRMTVARDDACQRMLPAVLNVDELGDAVGEQFAQQAHPSGAPHKRRTVRVDARCLGWDMRCAWFLLVLTSIIRALGHARTRPAGAGSGMRNA